MRIFNPVETFNRRLVTLAAIACTCAASTALADRRDDDEYRVRVTYADLDLSTPAGAQELYGRITRAAHIVCSDLEDEQIEHRESWQKCYDQAIGKAIDTINRPALTALDHAERVTRG